LQGSSKLEEVDRTRCFVSRFVKFLEAADVGVVHVEVLWFRVSRFSSVAIFSRILNLYSFHRLRISVIVVVGRSFTSFALVSL
jgi:hypothetical protein